MVLCFAAVAPLSEAAASFETVLSEVVVVVVVCVREEESPVEDEGV